jgi:hypothetical protein
MTKNETIVGIVTVVLLVAFGATVWLLRSCVSYTVTQELVGPSDDAMSLLLRDEPLEEIQAAVRRSGKHVDQISHLGGTLLLYAAGKRRIDLAKWLLKEGANPNGTWSGFGGVPLAEAISKRDVLMVRLLLAAGADPDLEMVNGFTSPRRHAEELGNREVLAALPPKRAATTKPATRPARGPAPAAENAN